MVRVASKLRPSYTHPDPMTVDIAVSSFKYSTLKLKVGNSCVSWFADTLRHAFESNKKAYFALHDWYKSVSHIAYHLNSYIPGEANLASSHTGRVCRLE